MYVIDNELYHHGILGMKWGIRRYQPYGTGYDSKHDGRFIGAIKKHRAERKARNNYNYKDSDEYKNAPTKSKREQSNRYWNNKNNYGKKTANQIEYDIRVKGADRNKVNKKVLTKKTAAGLALILGASFTILFAPEVDYKVRQSISRAKSYLEFNNEAVDMASKMKGLNEVKGGFTSGFKSVKRGKRIYENLKRASDKFWDKKPESSREKYNPLQLTDKMINDIDIDWKFV